MKYERHFDSYWDFLETCNKDFISESYKSSKRHESPEWSGTESFSQALTFARDGWMREKEKVEGSISLPFMAPKLDALNYDVSGCMVDVGRYVTGEPENMLDFVPQLAPKRVIEVAINGCFNSGIETSTVKYRGAWLVKVIDLLESYGNQVNLKIVVGASNDNGHHCKVSIDLKKAGNALNDDIIDFAVCSSAFLRRLIFSFWESDPEMYQWLKKTSGGYGRTVTMIDCNDNITFPILETNDKQAIDNQMMRVLDKYGIQIEK